LEIFIAQQQFSVDALRKSAQLIISVIKQIAWLKPVMERGEVKWVDALEDF